MPLTCYKIRQEELHEYSNRLAAVELIKLHATHTTK